MPQTGFPVDPYAAMMQGAMGVPTGAPETNPFLSFAETLLGPQNGQGPPPGMPPPMPPQDQGPPPDTFIPIPKNYRKPPRKHIEHADEYVKAWMKRSAEAVTRKKRRWHLFEDLYWNRRFLDQWNVSRAQAVSANRLLMRQAGTSKESASWKARQVVGVAPIIDNYTQEFQAIVFTAKEYFVVKPSPKNPTGSIEDKQYPTSKKIQQKLLATCDALQIKTRFYEFIQDGAIFGTAVAKTPWVEEYETIDGIDAMTGEPRTKVNIIRHGTAVDSINLERFLPDVDAKNGDINRWSGIGDRSEVSYDIIKSRFGTSAVPGPYNLNKAEFLERWPERGEDLDSAELPNIKVDKDSRDGLPADTRTYLQVWEWHGKLYFDDTDQPVESVCTIITGLDCDDPTEGILVRLQERPILKIGMRPYVLWQFTPKSSWCGAGLIEPNLDLIWQLSQALNQFANAVKLIAVPMMRRKVTAGTGDADGGNKIYPGKIWEYKSKPEEIESLSLGGVDLNSLLQLIQHLKSTLEERTSVSNLNRGIGDQRQTATEFSGLLAQSRKPVDAKLSLLKENALDRFGMIACSYLQQNIFEDQEVFMKGPNGIPQPVPLTTEELRSGDYLVEAALNIQDNAKVSKANIIMQLLPIMEQQAMPLLMFDNKRYIRGGLVEVLLDCLDITESAKVLEDVDEQTKQQLLEMMQPKQEPQGKPPSLSISFSDLPIEGQIQAAAQAGIQLTPDQVVQALMSQQQGTGQGGIPPQGAQPGGMPGQLNPGVNGGPVGPEPSNMNEILQRMQFDAQNQAPVVPGQQVAA